MTADGDEAHDSIIVYIGRGVLFNNVENVRVREKRTQARLQNEHEHVYEKMNTRTFTESNPSVRIWRK